MAIYVWECQNCGHEQEVERKMVESDIPPGICDGCQINPNHHHLWKKVIKTTSFVLNGGGWYKDGYQKGDK